MSAQEEIKQYQLASLFNKTCHRNRKKNPALTIAGICRLNPGVFTGIWFESNVEPQ
jgi:hypothetical protein